MWPPANSLEMSAEPPGLALASVDLEGLEQADLSPWFNPFLAYFAREADRCGGEVRVLRNSGRIEALTITDPVEHIASVFSRSPEVVEACVRARGSFGMYSDLLVEPSAEVFDIFTARLRGDQPPYRFRHPVRPVSREDAPEVRELMREVNGPLNERWLDGLPTPSEVGFLSEVNGRPAGVGWMTKVGVHARLHSLSVRVPYRRMGLGTDLLLARLLWAGRAGARDVLCEISRTNLASQAIATQGGLKPAGEIYFHRPV